MSFQDCLTTIQRAAGRELSDDELDDLITELQRRQRQKMLVGQVDNLDEAVLSAADDYARDMAEAALIEKRNAAINLKRRLEAIDFVKTRFADNPALGIEALLAGVNKVAVGSRRSVDAEQLQLKNFYLGGFMTDVERTGLWREFVSGQLDEDIARALWARNRSEPVPTDAPREAVQIADVIVKWQEVARQDVNKAGAWVKRMPGYIVRQSHDMLKIRAAGFEAWRATILPRLDSARTFDGADPESFLRGVYEGLASGVHLKSGDEAPSGFKGPANIAKRASQERVLHFKSGEDWFAYNRDFGTGNLREALMRGFEMNAQTTGLMRKLGTNPGYNLDQIADAVAPSEPAAADAFGGFRRGVMANLLAQVDGSARIPVSRMGAQVSASVRAGNNLSKLGAALFSQVTDIAIYGSEMRYQGDSMLSGVGRAVADLLKGRNRREMAEIDGMIGVVMDGMKDTVGARFSIADDAMPGALTRMQQLFFKWNGMTWWTDTLQASAARAMSHRMAFHRQRAFGDLDPDFRRVISLYGIDAGRWDIIRSATTKEADGRLYAVPDTVADLPDEAFASYLAGQGQSVSARRIADLKREIQDQMRTYFTDRAAYAVIEPDARTRAFMQRGTRPGTVEGEMLRFIGQFKSFGIAAVQRPLGREIYGRGSDTLSQALRNGNGEMLGMANLILWSTALGYVAMSAKDLAKGRTPRDPNEPKTWMAAMAQGGGWGIYGDFLFGEANRFGGGILSTIAGPTLGTFSDIHDLYTRVRDGEDSAAAAFKLAIGHVPFANLFYTRIALDYLILWDIQEWLNPGAMRRMEKRIERENNQTFLIRPSEVVR